MPTTQTDRPIQLSVESLGPNVLLCTGFSGQEAVSQLYRFQLDVLAERADQVKLDQLLGKKASLAVGLADGTKRHIHGLVSSAEYVGTDVMEDQRFSHYRIEVVPWLWMLTQTLNCRVFQAKSAVEIIEEVFKAQGMTDFQMALREKHPKFEYCVQYRESDFAFASRLMEEEGIFYFFKHTEDKHMMVLGDNPNAFPELSQQPKMKFEPEAGRGDREDVISQWREQRMINSGKISLRAHHFQLPSKSLDVNAPTKLTAGNNGKLEVYDFPGYYAKRFDGEDKTGEVEPDGSRVAKLKIQAQEARHQTANGESNCRMMTAGHKFTLESPPESVAEGPYVLTGVTHHATLNAYVSGAGELLYTNNFTCIPASVPFRPLAVTPRPIVHGTQSATVVGPAGEEIYTDKYGRVKVQFPWDREGKKDENSSCWVRVAQIHAGRGFGGIDIPRIGDEVVVSFMEGDPDNPLIVGRVYHAENMPPFGLPDKKVVCGLKTKTYKGDGYNELAMDDTPGNELIRVHGQYDMDSTIEHDLREHVLNDRSRDVTNNETITIGVDRTESVGNNESLTVGANKTINIGANHTETIGQNMTITIGSSLTETVAINYAETVGAAMQLTVGGILAQTVGASLTTSVGGSVTQNYGGNQTSSIGGSRKEQVAAKVTEKVGGNVSQDYGAKHTEKVKGKYQLKSSASATIEAANEILLKCGAASITLKSDGTINIKGVKININGSASITEKSMKIDSEASTKNTMKGAMIDVNASAICNVKGALVKIN